MKRLQAWIAAVAIAATASAAAADSPTALATRLLDQLDAGQYAAAEATFSPQMKAAVPADKLKAVWESLPALLGAAGARGEASVSTRQRAGARGAGQRRPHRRLPGAAPAAATATAGR